MSFKRLAKELLAGSRLVHLVRPTGANVLLFHGVCQEEPLPLRGMGSIHPESLETFMCWLQTHWHIVSLPRLLAGLRDGAIEHNWVAITFDDGLRCVWQHALPVLDQLAIPCTIFLITGAVGNRVPFWRYELNFLRQLGHAGLLRQCIAAAYDVPDDSELDVMAYTLAHYDREKIDVALDRCCAALGLSRVDYLAAEGQLFCNEEDLRSVNPDLVSFGIHSHVHPNFACLSGAEIRHELEMSLAFHRKHFSDTPALLAVPFGLRDAHYDDRLVNVAQELGMEWILTSDGTTNKPRMDSRVVARKNVGPEITSVHLLEWLLCR